MLVNRRVLFCFTAFMFLCGGVAIPGYAGNGNGNGNGNGGGGGDDPPPAALPDVEFDLRFIPLRDGSNAAIIEDMNIGLEVVGYLQSDQGDQGFLYDYRTDLLFTLEELISADDWQIMLDGDWTQSVLMGINTWGLVVGYLGNSDSTDRRGFILDTRTTPAIVHYPDLEVTGFADTEKSLLDKVNVYGDIVGHFRFSGSDYLTPFVFNPGTVSYTHLTLPTTSP